jgi:hypothetical protein
MAGAAERGTASDFVWLFVESFGARDLFRLVGINCVRPAISKIAKPIFRKTSLRFIRFKKAICGRTIHAEMGKEIKSIPDVSALGGCSTQSCFSEESD